MANCLFVPDGLGQSCVVCGIRIEGYRPRIRKCREFGLAGQMRGVEGSECTHLGAEVGTAVVPCCGGKTMEIPTFACGHANHPDPINVQNCKRCKDRTAKGGRLLIRIRRGLGDHIQLGVVLQHLRKYFPTWWIAIEGDVGYARTLELAGLCDEVCKVGWATGQYDVTAGLAWPDPAAIYEGHPSTKAEQCLLDVFGIKPESALCSYLVGARPGEAEAMRQRLGPRPFVLFHYEGTSHAEQKAIDFNVARHVVLELMRQGRRVLVLDADRKSNLPAEEGYEFVRKDHPVWGGNFDAASLAALASIAELCIGIDSGPGKVFAASGTPTITAWTGFHPLQFHGLNQNVLHLVPRNNGATLIGKGDHLEALKYFSLNYRHRLYGKRLAFDILAAVAELTPEKPLEIDRPVARYKVPVIDNVPQIAVAGGIGDALWCLTKVPALLREYGAAKCNIGIRGGGPPYRSAPFVERFDFVRHVWYDEGSHCTLGINPSGTYRYELSQRDYLARYNWLLIANGHLEEGQPLETWMPQWETDWDIASRFTFTVKEHNKAHRFRDRGPFVMLYLGPEGGNGTGTGHNRGELWTPAEWGELAERFRQAGRRVVVIGADYDLLYFRKCQPFLGDVENCIGLWHIAQTFAMMRKADCLIGYQSGLAIFGVFLGCKVVSWWRPQDNSRNPHSLSAFDERMAHCWANPKAIELGRYLPGIYGREGVSEIWDHVEAYEWLK